MEEMTDHRRGAKRRSRRGPFSDRLKVMNRVSVPTTESFNHKRNEDDTVGLTCAKMFVHLGGLHGFDGGASLLGSAGKSRLAKR